jgi:hypothetical protein
MRTQLWRTDLTRSAAAVGGELPWWAPVVAIIPKIGAAVPAGEAIGSCAAAVVLSLQGY